MTDEPSKRVDAKSVDLVVFDLTVRLALIALLVYYALQIIGPFTGIVIWGVILAVALYPVFLWLKRRLWNRGSWAAILITIVFLLIVIGPVSLLTAALVDNVQNVGHDILAGELRVPPPDDSVKDWPLVGDKIHQFWTLASVNLEGAIERIAPQLKDLTTSVLAAAAGTGLSILSFIASVIVAGCLFVPAERLSAGLASVAERISARRGRPFIDMGAATIRNVARGVIGISLLQSLLLGMGMLVAGVPAAGLFAIGCLFLGIIQVGPAILVIITLVWAWMELSTVSAIIFTVYMIPMMLLDNFLKPVVMSRGLSTPMLVIFIGVVGGTLTHGIIGLFIGPIVLAVAYELIVFWVRGDSPELAPGTEAPTAPSKEGTP